MPPAYLVVDIGTCLQRILEVGLSVSSIIGLQLSYYMLIERSSQRCNSGKV